MSDKISITNIYVKAKCQKDIDTEIVYETELESKYTQSKTSDILYSKEPELIITNEIQYNRNVCKSSVSKLTTSIKLFPITLQSTINKVKREFDPQHTCTSQYVPTSSKSMFNQHKSVPKDKSKGT